MFFGRKSNLYVEPNNEASDQHNLYLLSILQVVVVSHKNIVKPNLNLAYKLVWYHLNLNSILIFVNRYLLWWALEVVFLICSAQGTIVLAGQMVYFDRVGLDLSVEIWANLSPDQFDP